MGDICNSVNDKNTLETYNLINQSHLNKSRKKKCTLKTYNLINPCPPINLIYKKEKHKSFQII